jgi:ankyrin repeat protein
MSQEESPGKPKLIVPRPGQRGMTELHYAAYCNDPDAVRAQVQLGGPIDVRDDNGWTPLHWSIDMAQAWGEPNQVVSLLLAAGASANSVDKNGFSALMMACGRNNEAILEQLIEAGANVQTRSAGTTPLHEAASNNFSSGIRRLLALGADPAETDGRNRTPEQLAEECGFAECVAVLHAARRAGK